MQKQVKNAAKVIAKAVSQLKGEKFPLGQAQEVVARLYGFKDYNSLSKWLTPEAAQAEMMDIEREHAEENAGLNYGDEFVVETAFGRSIHAPAWPEECSYVRVVDRADQEIGYWTADEWRDDPEVVMGAILGALNPKGGRNRKVPLLSPLADDSKPAQSAEASKTPTLQGLPWDKVVRLTIDGAPYELLVDTAMLTYLWGPNGHLMDDDTPALGIFHLEDGVQVSDEITVGELRDLSWAADVQAFRDSRGHVFRFYGDLELSRAEPVAAEPVAPEKAKAAGEPTPVVRTTPLSQAEVDALMAAGKSLEVVVPVGLEELLDLDIEGLNDLMQERIAPDVNVMLSDLRYSVVGTWNKPPQGEVYQGDILIEVIASLDPY